MNRCAAWLFLLALIALPAFGTGITFLSCDAVPNGDNGAFLGPFAPVQVCAAGNMRTTQTVGGTAGLDFFLNTIDINVDNTLAAVGENHTVVGRSTTNPTWDVLNTLTFLRLDGTVRIQPQGPNDNPSVTITLTGMLGGPALQIGALVFDKTSGCPCTLFIPIAGVQAIAAAAVETITVSTVGRGSYRASGTPTFSSPEPAALSMVGLGFAFILACLWRKPSSLAPSRR